MNNFILNKIRDLIKNWNFALGVVSFFSELRIDLNDTSYGSELLRMLMMDRLRLIYH